MYFIIQTRRAFINIYQLYKCNKNLPDWTNKMNKQHITFLVLNII